MHVLAISIILFLGFWVYFKDKNSQINRVFLFLVFSIVLWLFTLFLFYTITHPFWVLHLGRLNFSAIISLCYFAFRFSMVFPKETFSFKKRNLLFLKVFTVIFFLITLLTPLIDEQEIVLAHSRQTVYGPLYFLFILYFVVMLGGAIAIFARKLKTVPSRFKNHVKYVLLGISITAVLGGVTNILFPYFGYQNVAKLGPISILFFVIVLSYAILKHNLFNIKLVLSEILVASFSLLLLVNIFLSNSVFEYCWKGVLFLIFIYFGRIMVGSVRKEIETEAQLEKYSRELKKTNEHLKELDKQKTEFMSFAAHQLRAPLTSVKGFASMITERGLGRVPKKVKGAAEKIYEASEAMSDSVDDYLNISRIEQGRMEYEMEELDLHELAQEVKEELEPTAHKKKLKLSLSSDKYKTYPVRADHSKLRQIIYNFTENAIKYTPKGKVTLRVSRQKGYVILAIKDSGIGMSQATIKKLFRRYSRAQNTQGISGTGLGLYVARKMIEAQKGKVWAESAGEGQGSTFFIKLPLLKKTKKKK